MSWCRRRVQRSRWFSCSHYSFCLKKSKTNWVGPSDPPSLPHQFRTRNDLTRTSRTRSISKENAAKSTIASFILPLITGGGRGADALSGTRASRRHAHRKRPIFDEDPERGNSRGMENRRRNSRGFGCHAVAPGSWTGLGHLSS